MSDNQSNNKRIAKNTVVLYFRMIFLMCISLYTSRVVLEALGVEDYGIYNVVGSFVSMFGLISASLTSACSRFLNFEIGRGDLERQKVVFSTAITIQWVIALVILIISEVVGVWYVNNAMVLPDDRLVAANWCFQFSIINFCMNLITVPYNASIVAHEKMTAFAYVSLYEGVAKLVISYLIFVNPFDRLVYYALMLLIVQFSVRLMYQVYCHRHFEECKFQRFFDKALLKDMIGYSVWQMIGTSSAILKGQGVNIILNLYFGPVVNAAKGVANQINGAVHQFSSNFMLALNPQITKSYASGDIDYMLRLVNQGSRLSFYLLFFLSLPIIVNAEYIMHLWLKEVPMYAVAFAQLTLVASMLSSISQTLIKAQNSTGKIRNYQLIVGGIQMLDVPLVLVVLYLGASPYSVLIVAVFVELCCFMARLFMIPFTIPEFKPFIFLKRVFFNCLMVSVFAIVLPCLHHYYSAENFITLIINVLICIICSTMSIWYVGCNIKERAFAMEYAKKIIYKKNDTNNKYC